MFIEITVFYVYSFTNVENLSHHSLSQFSDPLSANSIIHVIRLTGLLGNLLTLISLHSSTLSPFRAHNSTHPHTWHFRCFLCFLFFLYFNFFFLQQRVELFPDSLCQVETAMRSWLQNLSKVDKRLSLPESSVHLLFGFMDPSGHMFTINLLLFARSSLCEFSGELKLDRGGISFSPSQLLNLCSSNVEGQICFLMYSVF